MKATKAQDRGNHWKDDKITKTSREGKVIISVISLILLSASVLELQYLLVFGPFFGNILRLIVLVLGIPAVLITPFLMSYKSPYAYLPLGTLMLSGALMFLAPNNGIGHRLHYWTNKSNLNTIYTLSHEAKIHQMGNMRRHHKILNDEIVSNDEHYLTKAALQKAYANTIQSEGLDIEKVVELRDRLDRSSLISLGRDQGDFVLTIDGFLDNEYGYAYSPNNTLKVGDFLMPSGLPIIASIDLGDGWYFYYTT